MEKLNTVKICRKQSGFLIITQIDNLSWETVGVYNDPQSLLNAVRALDSEKVIIREYAMSQKKKLGWMYNEMDAIKAFGLQANKETKEFYFI
jgi:hypothetical protein